MQVIGKLPFDDTQSNHIKRLLAFILTGPVFPPDRPSTTEFQDLVIAILKPEQSRIGIPAIRRSAWYTQNSQALFPDTCETNVSPLGLHSILWRCFCRQLGV